jgi:predicted TIM-barrel fold metal-dependent hydrolase
LDTTIALSHLIFEGTFDRFPKLKVIAAHGGGYLPSYADRSDHACLVSPKSCNPNIQLKKSPTEYLKQLASIRLTAFTRCLFPARNKAMLSCIVRPTGGDHGCKQTDR